MSDTALFIAGAIVFAITVYGVVMAGGLAISRVEVEQNPHLDDDRVDDDEPEKRFPFRMKY